jgi:hypothetical protein
MLAGLGQLRLDRDDRRQLLASLTSRGEAVIGKTHEVNKAGLPQVFASLVG